MRKMDEMERAILLKSEEWGYRTLLLALSAWVLYCCVKALMAGASPDLVPMLLLLSGITAQVVSRIAIKQSLASGGEGPREPNHLLVMLLEAVAVIAILLAAGLYLASMA